MQENYFGYVERKHYGQVTEHRGSNTTENIQEKVVRPDGDLSRAKAMFVISYGSFCYRVRDINDFYVLLFAIEKNEKKFQRS